LYGQVISLSGEWKFALDSENKGLEESWFNEELKQLIRLPVPKKNRALA
jgi:beta-galactosidase/beta-glucuronidase